MTLTEYNDFREEASQPTLTAADLQDKSNRTLLYGYNIERDTWHVYLKDGVIVTVIYGRDCQPKKVDVIDDHDFIPGKRLYPDRCDLEFCRLLRGRGIDLPFTSFVDNVPEPDSGFHGFIL
jgi:hypothetical protein